jgi:hypothetical protein
MILLSEDEQDFETHEKNQPIYELPSLEGLFPRRSLYKNQGCCSQTLYPYTLGKVAITPQLHHPRELQLVYYTH